MTARRVAVAWGHAAGWARRHEYLTATAILGVILCVWFAPLFQGDQLGQPGTFCGMDPWAAGPPPDCPGVGRSGESDIPLQMQPLTQLAREYVHNGQLPTLNPYSAGGLPLIGDMQSALAFPPTWLALVLPVEDAWGFIKLLELLIAGLGAYALARHFRISRRASLVGAIVYMLSAPTIVWIQYPTGVVATLFPWLLLTSDRLYERASARRVVAVAAVVGLSLLAGHPETVLASASAVGVYLLVRIALDRTRRVGDRLRPALLWLAAHLLGVGIAAVAVVPFLIAHSDSISASFRSGPLTSLKLPLTSILTLAAPDIYGNGRPQYYGPLLFFPAVAAYFGLTAGALALIALVRRRRASQAIALAVVAVATLMTIYGLPPFYWFVDNVYPWSQAWLVHTFNIVALCAAVGGAAGIDTLLRRPLSRSGLALTLVGLGGAVLVVLAVAVTDKLLPAPRAVETDALLRLAVVFVATAVCVYALGRLRRGGLALALVLAVVVIDLAQFRDWNVMLPPDRAHPAPTPGIAFLQRQRRPFRIGLIRPTPQDTPVFWANLPMSYHLDSVEGYDFPAPKRWMDLRWFVLGHRGSGREILTYGPVPKGPVLSAQRMINTRFHVAGPGTPRPAGLRTAYDGPDLTIFEDKRALPRAYVVPGTKAATDRQALFALSKGLVRPAGEALVPPGAPAVRRSGGRLRPASFERVAPDRFRVRVPGGAAHGWLVVSESYTPDWRATVDGRPAKLYPTDLALMGLPVDGRDHVVEFHRSRTDVELGAAGTLVSIALALLLLAWQRRRERA